VLERLPFEELHGDKPSRVALIDFVNGADIRVIERRGRLRLALEAGQRLRVLGYFIAKKFQGHEAVKGYFLGFVDDIHSAPPSFSMMQKWEIVSPESGEESGIAADIIQRPQASQRGAPRYEARPIGDVLSAW
jgi:hypothetical protein